MGETQTLMEQLDRSRTEALTAPWIRDPWGTLRPPVNGEALRLSAALSYDTYKTNFVPWIRAGWQDLTFQMNGRLSDISYSSHDSRLERMATVRRRKRVAHRLRSRNQLKAVPAALRQREQTDAGKALIMAHPLGGGKVLTAISFMGTGKLLSDWIPNLRMETVEGEHRGFRELTEQLLENEDRILFPDTARLLGLERLSLRDMLEACRKPGSPFSFWLTGHSQGAAVMQLWCRRQLREGVLPQYIAGWGFGSAAPVNGDGDPAPAAYPLYHVINRQDLVPRMGAEAHLGLLLLYTPETDFRKNCCRWREDPASAEARTLVRPLLREFRNTRGCLLATAALFSLGQELPPEELLTVLRRLRLGDRPLERVIDAADDRLDALMNYVVRHTRLNWLRLYGTPMPDEELASVMAGIRPVMDRLGPKRFLTALKELALSAHRCTDPDGGYPWIAFHGLHALIPACWSAGEPPALHLLSRVEPGLSHEKNRR